MRKFNNFENWFIKTACENFIKQAEAEAKDVQESGKNGLFAPGYFTMVGKELLEHVDDLTLKPKKK